MRLGRAQAHVLRAIPLLLVAVAAVSYSLQSTFRHSRFGSNAYDLGIYDQMVWGYSNLEVAVPNTVLRTPTLMIDHFQPILFSLAPLYWVWDHPTMLLAAQAVLIAAASLPIFLFAREQLGYAAAVLFQLAYLVYFAVLGGNLFDFHEAAFSAAFLSLALYGALTRRNGPLLAGLALALLTKENLALTTAALGIYVAVVQRRWRLGLPIVAVSLAWFVVIFEWVLPALTNAPYANWFYPALGPGPGSAAKHLVTHPIDSVELLFTPAAKRTGLFNLFAPWLFLPLLSPLLLVMLPTIAERFLASKPAFWAQGFHYSLVIAPILAFAAIDTTMRLRRMLSGRARAVAPAAVAAVVTLAGLYFTFVRLRPLDELRRYTSAAHAREIEHCLETIPSDASVAATSALVPHLAHRERIYVLDERRIPPTRFYAIDAYTWTFPFTVRDIGSLVRSSLDRGYGVRCTKSGTVVLERGVPGRRLSPELQRLLGRA